MLDPVTIHELASIVGADNILTEKQDLICYSYDATQMEFLPDAVVHPADAAEVSAVLKLANRCGFPVFPRGAGSGFTGGALPKAGGVVLVVTRMNRILRIDTENLIAEVEPGVVTEQFQQAVEKLGLFYPPDPASLKFSTLGGNVAENAGGPRCVKYGVTRDFVMGLEVVLPTGEIIRTGGETYKAVVGYDMTRLLCGSEGTLGVITKIIFKLLPLPDAKKTMLTIFDSIDGAAKAVSTIIGAKIIPTTLEFMDYATLQCVEKRFNLGIPPEGRAVLLIEVDGDRDLIEKQASRIHELIQPLGLVQFRAARDNAESEELWRVRRLVSPSLRDINPTKYNEDIVVPRSKVPDVIRTIEKIQQKYGWPRSIFASTGKKLDWQSEDYYVEALAGSDIQTNPPATNDWVDSHDKAYTRQVDKLPPKEVLGEIDRKVDVAKMEKVLMQEGTKKFADPQKALEQQIGQKRTSLAAAK